MNHYVVAFKPYDDTSLDHKNRLKEEFGKKLNSFFDDAENDFSGTIIREYNGMLVVGISSEEISNDVNMTNILRNNLFDHMENRQFAWMNAVKVKDSYTKERSDSWIVDSVNKGMLVNYRNIIIAREHFGVEDNDGFGITLDATSVQ